MTEKLSDANFTVKEYQEMIKEFKTDIKDNIENQQQEIKSSIKQTCDQFTKEEETRARELAEEKAKKEAEELAKQEKEQQLRDEITQKVENDIKAAFDSKFEAL